MNKLMKTIDGNEATAHVAYAFTDVAAIYPITPSSAMAEHVDEWSTKGRKNIFGQRVKVIEMQSEAGAAGAVHGSLQGGALTTTFTASQGLLLMLPNMFKMSGELLPAVFHVSARAIAAHALSIFGDHQDVMCARQTGFAILASNSVQEAMDLAAVAHLSAIKGRVPFLHFFDGFRTSHEVQKIEMLQYDELSKLVDQKALNEFRNRALRPESPVTRGTAQNPDIYFQGREAANRYYDAVIGIVENYMNEINKLTGRNYKPFNYVGAQDAERVIVAMGSVCETIEETIKLLTEKGEKVGLLKVHLFRPFSIEHMLSEMPKTVKRIAVLDRTKEPGASAEPLYEDIRNAYYDVEDRPLIVGGRYGLGSKDTTPAQILSVYENLKLKEPKNRFTIGIVDDVTFTSLPVGEEIEVTPEGTIACKFYGLGSDGTVGANKSSIKIIGDKTKLYAQGYFSYDSKKSGGLTISHLRFGKEMIKAPYLIMNADFVACHNPSYVYTYDMLKGLKKNGTFLLNCPWTAEELNRKLPASMKAYIAQKNISLYIINAVELAKEIGLGGKINMVMQAAFFKLANVIPFEEAVKYLKDAVVDNYGLKGEKIVAMNHQAIDMAIERLIKVEVPEAWLEAEEETKQTAEVPEFISKILDPMSRQEGDNLPVSAFLGREDGTFPNGTARFEKRKIAVTVPKWLPEYCIQCNQCAFVCPHAVIRPFLMTEEEIDKAPEGIKSIKAIGGKAFDGMNFSIQVSVSDCTGCGNCADVCPAPKHKALVMEPIEEQMHEQDNFDYAFKLPAKKNPVSKEMLKGSQFEQPLFEFSGACAGCGETPYIKVITQLFGDRMVVANATGCSSIYSGSAPSTPYSTNQSGMGPAWGNSLFEDNAEYGLGMLFGTEQIREKLSELLNEFNNKLQDGELKVAVEAYLRGRNIKKETRELSDKLLTLLQTFEAKDQETLALYNEIMMKKDFLAKKSNWIIGGDGWAYDIGYGGLDHVISTGQDVNILVLDTEVYSNTGGQASKSTPTAAIAQFAAGGKRTKKKELGLMAATYGYVYVAQVAMGADKNHFLKVLAEAEAYDGPSIIVAYAPCINQGLKKGMGKSQEEEKLAVQSGYWHLFRYNPMLKEQGKNPFVLDSKEPTLPLRDFLLGEVRYSALLKSQPEIAEELYAQAEKDMKEKYELYKRLASL